MLLTRVVRPTRATVLRLMTSVGEGETLRGQPDLLDSVVAAGRDPITRASNLAELRAVISPRGARLQSIATSEELRRLSMPTLLIWGDRDPVASVAVAEAAARLIPQARVEVLPAGHVPWLGHPDRVAELPALDVHPGRVSIALAIMRVARFSYNDEIRFGVVPGGEDGEELVSPVTGDPLLHPDPAAGTPIPLADVRLLSPILPSKVIGIGAITPSTPRRWAGCPKPLIFLKPTPP